MTKKSATSKKPTPDEIADEERTLKDMGLKVGMYVQNMKQPGRKGKIKEVVHEEGKTPIVVYHRTKDDGTDVTYRNRPSLITTEVDEE